MKLEELIPLYGEQNSALKELDKQVKQYNTDIKNLMRSTGTKELSVDGWKASFSESTRDSMNEEKLLEIAHKHNLKSIIQTKECIDYDALESQIYNGRISQDILLEIGSCTETKVVETLRVTKAKEEK